MPQLQALQAVPSFTSQLGQALGSGLTEGISSGLNSLMQIKQQKQTGTALARYLGKPEMSDVFGTFPIEIQQEIVKAHGKKKQEEEIDTTIAQQSFNRLAELAPEIGFSILPPGLSPTEKGAGDRAEFESQKASLISALRDKVNKGVLTNQKFQYIVKDLLPSHGDRIEVKKRKLKAIGEQLGLDTSALGEVKDEQKIYGGGRIKITDPKTKESFYPSSIHDVQEAKNAGWKVTGG